ncbi:hypothetical protein D3C73_974510 [compost metagenome]
MGDVVLAATAAAEDARRQADQRAGLDARFASGLVGGDQNDRSVIADTRNSNSGGFRAQAITQVEGKVTQIVSPTHLTGIVGDNPNTSSILRCTHQVGSSCSKLLLAEAVKFLLRGLELVQSAGDAVSKLSGRNLQKLRKLGNQGALCCQVTECVQANKGFNAAVS